MIPVYLIISTVLFFLAAVTWTRRTLLNFFFKILFSGMFLLGFLITLQHFGFVFRE